MSSSARRARRLAPSTARCRACRRRALGQVAIKAALERAKTSRPMSEVVMGQVLAAGQGMGPARQAAMAAGMPPDAPRTPSIRFAAPACVRSRWRSSRDRRCLHRRRRRQESMSLSPHVAICARAEDGQWSWSMHDQRRPEGHFQRIPYGRHGRKCRAPMASPARSRRIRPRLAEQGRAAKGRQVKDEIVPVTVKREKGDVVAEDDYPRGRQDRIGQTETCLHKDGTVTAGNASGINDGAAAVVLMTARKPRSAATPLARIASWATAGVDPK